MNTQNNAIVGDPVLAAIIEIFSKAREADETDIDDDLEQHIIAARLIGV